MTYYQLSISNWDASDTSNGRHRPLRSFSKVINEMPTPTATQFVVAYVKDFLQKRAFPEDSLTSFMMHHSQEAFSEIWNNPEEDIWDEL